MSCDCNNLLLVGAVTPSDGQSGTTLTASVSATGKYTRTFHWTMNKTVTPHLINLFQGDTGIAQYTIQTTKDSGTLSSYITGEVCVNNGGAVSTENLTIKVSVTMPPSSTVIASTNVSVSSQPVIDPGVTACYGYTINIPNIVPGATYKVTADVTITNHSGHLDTPFGPSPSNTTNFSGTPTLINDTLTVNDTNGNSFLFTTGGSNSYTMQYTCSDEGSHTNTATATLQDGTVLPPSSATVIVKCFALGIAKTANTFFTRTYVWTISKFADNPVPLVLAADQQFLVNYFINVNATFTDSNFSVTGTITLTNTAPIPATINSITDLIPGGTAVISDDVVYPFDLPAYNGTITFNYSVLNLTGVTPVTMLTNTATATLQNYFYNFDGTRIEKAGTTDFIATAIADFNNAKIAKVNESIIVMDSIAGNFGMVTYGIDTLPKTFTYQRIIGPFGTCGNYTVNNEAYFVIPPTTTPNPGDISSWTIDVSVPCNGCTLTIGYWKTHAGFGPQPDMVTPLLPIWLGIAGGQKSIQVTTASQAVTILNFQDQASNGIAKLYAQLLAAKLNKANGADATAVASTISAADTFLATHGIADWNSLNKVQKNQVLSWATTLDNYNNGLIGPGHCSF